MSTAAIIVAAGRGARVGGALAKQYRPLAGRPVLHHTIAAFARHPGIDRIIVVVNGDDRHRAERIVADFPDAAPKLVIGGDSRAASVCAGLRAADGAGRVLIHDAARPLVGQALIGRVIAALAQHAGAAPALAVSDALWRGSGGRVQAAVARAGLFRAQTPQGFQRAAILAAHAGTAGDAADDVEVALAAGLDVAIVEGEDSNLKITYARDFERAERLMEQRMETPGEIRPEIRCGNGFDVHAFGPGDSVTLCGVTIAHARGLRGHSDADVGLHALCDAIYGALAEGDIGQHFPPSDPRWKGVGSALFLRHAMGRVAARGLALSNADVTLICEAPKIGPHAREMREKLAEIMAVDLNRLSVKATTTERLGFAGRREGIAAIATVALVAA